MSNKSIRVPKDLLERIDYYVKEKRYYSTRADFVISALRELIFVYSRQKREASVKLTEMSPNDFIGQVFSSLTKIYLESFKIHSGKTTQINFRIPEGLSEIISHFLRREYGFERKSDFPRAAIICLLSHLYETDEILNESEQFIEDQKRIREEVFKVVVEGFENNLSAPVFFNETLKKFTNKE